MQWFSTRDNTCYDIYGTEDPYQNDDCTILLCIWYFANFRNFVLKYHAFNLYVFPFLTKNDFQGFCGDVNKFTPAMLIDYVSVLLDYVNFDTIMFINKLQKFDTCP